MENVLNWISNIFWINEFIEEQNSVQDIKKNNGKGILKIEKWVIN